jgi:hypothetical protein
MDGEELAKLRGEIEAAANSLHAQAVEIHELTKRLETLSKDTPAWYAGMRDRVEARVALEQAD